MFDQSDFSVSADVRASGAPRIVALGTAVPERRWSQEQTYRYLADKTPLYRRKAIEGIFMRAGIAHRHFALTPERFDPAPPADEGHEGFKEEAPALAERAARAALEEAGLQAGDIHGLVVATSTGYLCPGVAARLAPRLGLSNSVMRSEVVGAGCAAALPALQRGHDYLAAHPTHRVLVVCVEICSACVYVDDDLETAVGMAICADGAAAVILEGVETSPSAANEGAASAWPRLTAFKTAADPDFLDTVGFAQRDGRLRIILSKKIPDIAITPVREAVGRALNAEGLTLENVDHWVVHSGGRRVLDRLSEGLSLTDEALALSRQILAEKGNMSSPTVLFVLAETLRRKRPQPGEVGVLVALGPGLVAETAILRW